MNIDNDEEQDKDIIDIRHLKRPKIQKETVKIISEAENEIHSTEPIKPKKSKLRFKRKATTVYKHKPKLETWNRYSDSDNEVTTAHKHRLKAERLKQDSDTDNEVVRDKSTSADESITGRTARTTEKSRMYGDYQEFGDGVNGYKFVKHKQDSQASVELPNRHSVFIDDSYMLSYEPIKIVEGDDKYALPDFGKLKSKLQTYDEYVAKWKCYDKGLIKEARDIHWPNLLNSFENLSTESLKDFLKDDKKNWKTERVRWHPDNLSKKLHLEVDQDVIMSKITHVFQMINDVWEREMKN